MTLIMLSLTKLTQTWTQDLSFFMHTASCNLTRFWDSFWQFQSISPSEAGLTTLLAWISMIVHNTARCLIKNKWGISDYDALEVKQYNLKRREISWI